MKYLWMIVIVLISQSIFAWFVSTAEAFDPSSASTGYSAGSSMISITVNTVILTKLKAASNGTYCVSSNDPDIQYDIIIDGVVKRTALDTDLIRDGDCSSVRVAPLIKTTQPQSVVVILASVE